MNYKNGKIAKSILELQNEDGTWGNVFHSMSIPSKRYPLTTEQALRRLRLLGFSIEDEPIRKAVDCMTSCLRGERKIDNYWEKTIDWDLYTKLMLSAWVRVFEPDNETALYFANHWVYVIEKAFECGTYDHKAYQKAYMEVFYQSTNGAREIDFVTFYELTLLQGLLSSETERNMLDYILEHEKGIYYIYYKPIRKLPDTFQSLEASRYLAAVDILSGYASAKEKLDFVAEWLNSNMDQCGQWDFGPNAKDNIYFPLSDSWRKPELRKADCTAKVKSILNRLTP